MSPHEFLNPAHWRQPRGYSNGVAARGRLIVTGGVIGWNAEERFESDDFARQATQALQGVVDILACAGAKPHHLVRLTWYVTDKHEYLASLKDLGAAYREIIGKHFPAMALVQVVALVEDRAKVEIEATAVVPEE